MTSSEVYIGIPTPGRYQCHRLVNGLYRAWIGPKFETPREAHDYAQTLRGIPTVPATRSGQPQTRVEDNDGAALIESPDPAAPPVDVTGDSIGFGF